MEDFAGGEMTFSLEVLHLLSAAAGLGLAVLMVLFRRFGPATWMLAIFLVPAGLASLVLTSAFPFLGFSATESQRWCLSLLVLACPGGTLASYSIDRENYRPYLRKRWLSLCAICLAAPSLALALLVFPRFDITALPAPEGSIALGYPGFFAALYLLGISVAILANLEQTLRSAQEYVRWEIKFLLMGMAICFGGIIYISSKILLYPPSYALLSPISIRLFPLLFLISCALILISWRRSSGHGRITVSHGVIYSSITLLSVGIYLVASSLAAKWASTWVEPVIPVEALVFLLAILVLAVGLLWTDFRHRIKLWIRRNLLAGTYDYRLYWLEANERVRFIDRPQEAARSLTDIVQRSLGAIDVSVWMRLRHPNRIKLLAAGGTVENRLPTEMEGIVEKLLDIEEPVRIEDIPPKSRNGAVEDFAAQARASLLVPLQSSGRLVGLLTLGPDRSGRPYGWEAHEFLGVLGKHAAAELHKADLLSTLVQAKETEAFRLFATFLLHDLKNFASTLSLVARNSEKHQGNPDFQRDSFRAVFHTAEKMKNLCNSLRSFAGNLAANKKLDNLNHIVQSVADNFTVELADRLAFDLGQIPPINVDREEIGRVIQNLILNAREAIAPDGRIILRTRSQDGLVELAVEDNGRGMTREFIERELFLPFHTTKSDGLGIGLFQSKRIVDAHKGTIRVASQIGKGTTVLLGFPAVQAVPEESAKKALSSQALETPSKPDQER